MALLDFKRIKLHINLLFTPDDFILLLFMNLMILIFIYTSKFTLIQSRMSVSTK